MAYKLSISYCWFQFLHYILFLFPYSTPNSTDKLTASDGNIYCKFQADSFACREDYSATRFYYDLKLQDCAEFHYRGCPSTYGMYSSKNECREACQDVGQHRIKKNISANIVCRLQHDFGDCNSYFPMWYYDVSSHLCKGFSYSGCGGNANRFETPILCASHCGKLRVIEETTTTNSKIATENEGQTATNETNALRTLDWKELCKFQPNTTYCKGDPLTQTGYYFDLKMEDCKRFQFGGCPDDHNYFYDMTSCRDACKDDGLRPLRKNVTSAVFCHFQPDFGQCNEYNPMWYYNVAEQTCRGFSFSGCGGNSNRFETRDVCNAVCKS